MGSFEKLLVLTVIFLSAVVLAVSLTAPQKEGQLGGGGGRPSVVENDDGPLEDRVASADLAAGESAGSGRSISEGNRIPPASGVEAGTPRTTPAGSNGSSVFLEDSGRAGQASPADLGALSAGARPADYPLSRGPRFNDRGERRILREVPGLDRSPLEGQRTWSVREGDTWADLARLFYGDERWIEHLQAANDSWGGEPDTNRIAVPVFGATEELAESSPARSPREVRGADPEPDVSAPDRNDPPSSEPNAPVDPEPEATGGTAVSQTYVVQPNETLSGIAKRFYGKSSLYPVIFEANRDVLASPDFVPEGTELVIPPRD